MPIHQYDLMNKDDQAQYIGHLYGNAVQILWDQKRDTDAEKVRNLFKQKPGAAVSDGVAEVKSALAGLRNLPSDKPYHVEHAFADTLRSHGVPLSVDELKQLTLAGKSFKPLSSRE